MDRREFLTGVLALAGGAAAPPLLAHHRGHDAVESGARLLLAVRVGSRGSRELARGLRVGVTVARPRRRFLSIEAAVESLGPAVSRADRRRLERNLSYLADYLDEVLGRREAHHFCSHWHHGPGDVFEARAHLSSCGACRGAWKVLIRGTGLDLIPFVYEETVTVVAGPEGPSPRSPLRLPEVPKALRPALDGKDLRLRVNVDRYGVASVTRVESRGISDFVVERAVAQIERTPWTAATRRSGRTVDEDVRVIFRWRS